MHDNAVPLVSIIIANYNYGRFLAEAIHSALNQTYKNVEVILVDDGSTDESLDVLKQYQQKLTFLTCDHGGQCAAINKAFAHSRGDFIILLDADDYLTKNAVQLHIDNFAQNRDITKSQGYMQCVDTHGGHLSKTIPARLAKTGLYRDRVLEHGPWTVSHAWTSGNAWRRTFLQAVFPLPEQAEALSSPDGCLNVLSELYGPIGSVEKIVVYYRIHGDNKGPVSDIFSVASIQKRLTQMRNNFLFIQKRAKNQDIDVPFDYWWRWKASWRSNLSLRAANLLDPNIASPSFYEVVASPFKSRNKNPLMAGALSLVLASTYCLPKQLKLSVIQGLLKLKKPSTPNQL